MIVHVDYVWVDGLESPRIRSKSRVENVEIKEDNTIDLPLVEWNFDGSSTEQATTGDSERILAPKRVYRLSEQHYAVMCEVLMPSDEREPHISNHRAALESVVSDNDKKLWVGFEQEYFITKEGKNIAWPKDGLPIKDTRYYCSSGGVIKCRNLVREHASRCNTAGISVVGYNTEVSPGQWEYQVFADDPVRAGDDLWMSRYLLQLIFESEGLGIDWDPKPHQGWNGSGCHTNFSTQKMREEGGDELFNSIMSRASSSHSEDMAEYGVGNQERMTGTHETSSFSEFSHGVGARDVSIRIPNSTVGSGWKGYAEDRRPASNCDPYKVIACVYRFSE